MCLGLKSLHDKKIVHRDLKTANIFISENGTYKLGDLNVSKVMKSEFARTQIGTPYYTPPEIWKDKPYGNKCDLWSLGCVLYEMAASRPPFDGRDLQGLHRSILRGQFSRIPKVYSNDLWNIITCLLKQIPQLRPSAEEVLSLRSVNEHYKGKIEITHGPKLDDLRIIGTIKLKNNNIKGINNVLPKANY